MTKKVIAALLALCLSLGMLAGCGGNSGSTSSGSAAAPAEGAEGKIINIYSWNDEFRQLLHCFHIMYGRQVIPACRTIVPKENHL